MMMTPMMMTMAMGRGPAQVLEQAYNIARGGQSIEHLIQRSAVGKGGGGDDGMLIERVVVVVVMMMMMIFF
eukprot:2611638-Rhodomonas_salina.1